MRSATVTSASVPPWPRTATGSTITYGAGQTRGNNAVVGIRKVQFPPYEPHSFSVKVAQPSGTVHVIIDVFGYFE